jgi:hypothetical protein
VFDGGGYLCTPGAAAKHTRLQLLQLLLRLLHLLLLLLMLL